MPRIAGRRNVESQVAQRAEKAAHVIVADQPEIAGPTKSVDHAIVENATHVQGSKEHEEHARHLAHDAARRVDQVGGGETVLRRGA